MVFSRKKHKLPKFPPNIRPTFKRLCEVLPSDNLHAYQAEVDAELAKIVKSAEENPLVNLRLGREIAERCQFLLEVYDRLTPSQKALAVGAIRYFVLAKDSFSEEQFASGFHDDASIVNHVLEELDIEDRFIELD